LSAGKKKKEAFKNWKRSDMTEKIKKESLLVSYYHKLKAAIPKGEYEKEHVEKGLGEVGGGQ